jgi:hypothetical protein
VLELGIVVVAAGIGAGHGARVQADDVAGAHQRERGGRALIVDEIHHDGELGPRRLPQ